MTDRIPDEDLFFDLLRVADIVDQPPTTVDVQRHGEYSPTAYLNRFDNWDQVLDAAGFEKTQPKSPHADTSDHELLDELRAVADELGHPPLIKEMNNRGEYPPSLYERRFGTWNKALSKAGLGDRGYKKVYSDKELLAEIDRLQEELGRLPTAREMDELGEYHHYTYMDRFGSWSEAKGLVENRNMTGEA